MESKIKVPPFVDKWIKENKLTRWWDVIARWEKAVPEEDREVYGWYENYNEDDFILAWITGDYEVEEESLYFVEFPTNSNRDGLRCLLNTIYSGGELCISFNTNFIIKKHLEKYAFTEREIKDIDERYWSFAVPVEEAKYND